MIDVGRSRPLILLNNYTFAQTTSDKRYWNCSQKLSAKCPAKLKLNDAGKFASFYLCHNHAPPNYIKTVKGKYVKV